MPALQKKHKKSSVHNIKSVMNTRYGSGRRIRTLTYGVRVRCATFTQSRYVLTNKNYYTDFAAFVKSFFHIPRKKAAQGSDRGERAEPCAEREVFYLPCACTRSAPVRYLPSGL